jgi:spore coat polysaccharide biosynthesis protein SpsF
MKTAAIIQARMGSTRYPGKVLDEIAGVPMLQHIVERVRYAHLIDAIVIATTTNSDDRILLKRAREWQVIGFAGPEHDVLKRYVAAAALVDATHVVRITGDNPLIEPSFIDGCVAKLREENADYCFVDGCILGTGVEAITVAALKKQDALATRPHQREHVCPYVVEHPDEFKVVTVVAEPRFRMPESVRLTVDTKEDIKLIRRIYRRLHQAERIVSLGRAVELLKQNPEWVGLNKDVFQKPATSSELEEAEAVEADDTADETGAAEVSAADAEQAPAEEAGDLVEEAAVEPEPPPPAPSLRREPSGLRAKVEAPPANDKLDSLMADALTKEAEEARRKEEAPSLDDVLAKAQEEPKKAKPNSSALDQLFGPDKAAEEAPEQPAAEPPHDVEEQTTDDAAATATEETVDETPEATPDDAAETTPDDETSPPLDEPKDPDAP